MGHSRGGHSLNGTSGHDHDAHEVCHQHDEEDTSIHQERGHPPVTQSAMLVPMGSFQTGSFLLVSQQRFLGRTARTQTSTQQPPVNCATGNLQSDAPLPLIREGLGGLEPAHPV